MLGPVDVAAAGGGRWGDLRLRAATAVVLAPVVLLCIWFGGPAWAALMVATGAGLGLEWAGLCRGAAGRRWLVPGAVYIGVGFVALAGLRWGDAGRGNVLFLVLTVWACDIGAYAVGRLVGGAKLAPAISPGKTWSGAVGGLVAAMVAGGAVAEWTSPELTGTGGAGRAVGVALLLGVASQAGDLLESWMKRRFGVKDSGRSIPGHGGLLDRLDGLLAAAPVAAALAATTGRGGALWH